VPSYFYECQKCAKVFTEVRKIDEYDQPATHPDCGTSTSKRVIIGPFSFIKGSNRQEPSTRQAQSGESTHARRGTVRMFNCKAIDCGTGMKLSGDVRVEMDGTELRGNRVGIDMAEEVELRARWTNIE
jgi:putative FmdB family regulatory protein